MLAEGLECGIHSLVVAIVDGVEGTLSEKISGNECLNGLDDQVLRLIDIVPACWNSMLRGKVNEIVQQLLIVVEHSQQLLVIFGFAKHRPVALYKLEHKLRDDLSISDGDVVRSDGGGILRNKDIGNYAAAAIRCAAVQSPELLLFVGFDAVAAIQFAFGVTVEKLFFIGEKPVCLVVFLNAAATRGVVACDCKPDGTLVAEVELLLHKTFAKRAAAHN